MLDRCHFENSWFCICVVRTLLPSIAGALAGLTRSLVSYVNSWQLGALLQRESEQLFLTFRLDACIMDEATPRSFLGSKGASGRKICHFCANAFSRQAGDAANLTRLSGSKVPVSDDNIFEVIELLRVQEACRHHGQVLSARDCSWMDVSPRGCYLQCCFACPPSQWLFDPMHVFYSHGLASWHLHLLLEHLKAVPGLSLAEFTDEVVACFAALDAVLAHGDRSLSLPWSWKCSGATTLRFLCWAAAFLRRMKFTRRSAAPPWPVSALAQSYTLCYDAFLFKVHELYPAAAKPKHYYGLRLSEQYLRTGVCIDCYTMERKPG